MPIPDKLIITPKEAGDKPIAMTVFIPKSLRDRYTELSSATNVSRNEIVGMALQFALDHMEVQQEP